VIYNNEVRRFNIATLTLSETFCIVAEPHALQVLGPRSRIVHLDPSAIVEGGVEDFLYIGRHNFIDTQAGECLCRYLSGTETRRNENAETF
jgi:hypothetical protein